VNAELNDEEGRCPRENLRALSEVGWTGALNEIQFGGLGLGQIEFAEAAYRIGQADASTGLVYVTCRRGADYQSARKRRSKGALAKIEQRRSAWYLFDQRARHRQPLVV